MRGCSVVVFSKMLPLKVSYSANGASPGSNVAPPPGVVLVRLARSIANSSCRESYVPGE
jgi:hypothetical protein